MSLVETKLPNLVYDYVKALPGKEINHISPSQLGGCMRKHFFAIKHVPQTTPPSAGALVNFQLGFLFEDLFTKSLESSFSPRGGLGSLQFQDQLFIEDKELNVAGTCDFLLYDKEADEYEVIDTKTESILAGGYRKREKKSFIEAHPEYEIQLGTYMLMLKRQGKNVTRGRFVTIIKDNGSMQEHFVILTPALEEKIMTRIRELNEHLKNNTIPRCECVGWMVGYCGYGDPKTQITNSTKKIVNSTCCSEELIKGDSNE